MRLETGVGDWRQEKESGYEMRQETGRAGDRRQCHFPRQIPDLHGTLFLFFFLSITDKMTCSRES